MRINPDHGIEQRRFGYKRFGSTDKLGMHSMSKPVRLNGPKKAEARCFADWIYFTKISFLT
jgi:hypothetical protein